MMNWDKLLSIKRFGLEERVLEEIHDRTQFQRDFDRLIFSSPFRRLQDKTQVFALPGSVFVHNRLTHSLEVSSVGRSLGNMAAKLLRERNYTTSPLLDEIGSVVATACLAHDLGNPPFGHSGESAMSHYFSNGRGRDLKDRVSEKEWLDLTHFEGNANALRLLTHQFNGRRKGGFSLTYTSVASVIKYPFPSGAHPKGKNKYGYFQAEKNHFEQIVAELGLTSLGNERFARHPLVYLVEVADDICYQFMDIEDSHKLKILTTEEVKVLFLNFLHEPNQRKRFEEVCVEVTDANEQIAYLRASVISLLVRECVKVFIDNQDAILRGEFEKPLIDALPETLMNAMKECERTAYAKIYRHPSVVEVEIAGYKILGSLLSEFVEAVLNPNDYYSGMILPFIPEQYKVSEEASVYTKVLSVLDFISGMTDVYALDLYRKIQGTGLSLKRL